MIMNHGFIPVEDYVTGMDSRRESPFVASNGYVAIHPDFRNYAGSDDDENASQNLTAFGLGRQLAQPGGRSETLEPALPRQEHG